MQDINEIFRKTQELKAEIRGIRTAYREQLFSNPDYEELKQKLENHRLRKIQIENGVKALMSGEFEKLEKMQKDLADFSQMLSDIALSTYLKGEEIKVEDGSGEYEPQFAVKFKRKK